MTTRLRSVIEVEHTTDVATEVFVKAVVLRAEVYETGNTEQSTIATLRVVEVGVGDRDVLESFEEEGTVLSRGGSTLRAVHLHVVYLDIGIGVLIPVSAVGPSDDSTLLCGTHMLDVVEGKVADVNLRVDSITCNVCYKKSTTN